MNQAHPRGEKTRSPRGRAFPAKPRTGSTGTVDVNPVQKQHMKIDVQVQVRSDSAVDDGKRRLEI